MKPPESLIIAQITKAKGFYFNCFVRRKTNNSDLKCKKNLKNKLHNYMF